ncbi:MULTISPECIES: hypothetical protein [Aquimarina]|uniref:hypothetical protein n=1 Tax=Aquimarina TaxID=290174 RepID=UPI000D698FC9|nr:MULTISPECIES: hypothetical protein [Aquimarina]
MKYIYSIGFLLIIISCSKQNNNQIQSHSIDVDSLIISLNTQEKKEKFLADLFQQDQNVRNADRENEILKKNNYDINSSEYKEYRRKINEVDSLNYLKTSKYLKEYGYPTFKSDNHKVAPAIKTICLHQPFDKQAVLFPYIYKAYNNGFINREHFSFLLNKMHIMKYGESHPHAVNYEENIEQLLEKLQLK